jgi:hypothetical protein
MKNIPAEIFLQHGVDDYMTGYDFSDLVEVTWCRDRIEKNDLHYIHIDKVKELVSFFAGGVVDKKYILEHLNKIS